jgi:tyrosine-protein kinase Etk/Wzc
MNSATEASKVNTRPWPDEDDDTIDLNEIIGSVMGGWPTILGAIVVALGFAWLYLFVTLPIYTADALIQVESDPNSTRFAFMEAAGGLEPEIPAAAEVEILKSRMVLGKVVDRMGLDIIAKPIYLPLLGQGFARRHHEEGFGGPPFSLSFLNDRGLAWGGEKIKVTTFDVPDGDLSTSFTLELISEAQYRLLNKRGELLAEGTVGQMLTVEQDADLFRLYVQTLNAPAGTLFELIKQPRGAAIANVQKHLSATPSRSATGMVNLTYQDTDPARATAVLGEILNVYQTQNVERRSAEAEQTLEFLNEQLPELKADVESAEARLNKFKVDNNTADLTQETAIVLQRSVELDQARAELTQQRNEALQRFTANHPVVESIDSQVAQLEIERSRLAARIKRLPDIEQAALQLQRDLQVSTALYVSLLNRSQELEVVKSGTIGSIRIIDTPVTPRNASKPKVGLVLALSFVLGGMMGVLLVFLLDALRTGVEDPAVTEKRLGLATYGSIPYSVVQSKLARALKLKKARGNNILALADPDSITMEALRSVRTSLHFARMDAPNNVIMLTGPEPDLGKSFASVNLGAVLAQAGERVVVIDGDMRRGHIHKMIGNVSRSPGLSEVLSGTATLEQCLKQTPIDQLFLLPTGAIPPNPSELLVHQRFVELLRELSSIFDHVLIDTPPVLAVTDASVIGRHAGITLIVLKAGQHPLRMIEDTINRLSRSGVTVRGSLFNQVGLSRKSRYGYHYGYQYSYKAHSRED